MINPSAPTADHELECAIERYTAMLANAPTRSERETAWQWLCRAHQLRSAERVSEMEEEQGIA